MIIATVVLWTANAFLLVAYLLLGRRMNRAGWAASLIGNILWWVPTFTGKQWPFFCLSVVFAGVAGYNLWKAVSHARQPGTQAA